MENAIDTIFNHRSIRKYSDKKIDEATLSTILKAACSGSTMGNMQLFSVVVTEDRAMIAKMAPAHFNQPVFCNAPLVLTFCADFNRFNKFCQFRDAETEAYSNLQSYHWAVVDALIAAQNACVAAEALGLGICWLGTITYNCDQFVEMLNLPKQVFPIACVTVGYPAETPELTDKLPVEALVHRETYHDYSEADINRLYHDKENHPNTLNLLKENDLPNLARIFTEKRYTKADNEHFAKILVETLKKQGFLK